MINKFDWSRFGAAVILLVIFLVCGLIMYGLSNLFFVVLPPLIGVWSYITMGVLFLAGLVAVFYHDMGKYEK